MSCAAEMCAYWTGNGCICSVFGTPQMRSTDCAECGHVMDDHNADDRGGDCLVCGTDCEGYQ